MTGYTMQFTCPTCASDMTPGRSTRLNDTHTTHTATCSGCGQPWEVYVTAVPGEVTK